MSEQQTEVEETYSEGQEETTDETASYQEEAPVSELSSVKQQLEEIRAQNQQLFQMLQPQEKVKAEEQLSEGQLAQMQQNPALFQQWLKAQVNQSKAEIQTETRKQLYDKKAYEEFPALNSSKQFQEAVTAQMREFITTGEYSKENPMLVYRASQIVAGKLNMKQSTQGKSKELPTSEAPGTRRSPQAPSSSRVSDNDPKLRFLKMFGVTDAKKVEAFRSQLQAKKSRG